MKGGDPMGSQISGALVLYCILLLAAMLGFRKHRPSRTVCWVVGCMSFWCAVGVFVLMIRLKTMHPPYPGMEVLEFVVDGMAFVIFVALMVIGNWAIWVTLVGGDYRFAREVSEVVDEESEVNSQESDFSEAEDEVPPVPGDGDENSTCGSYPL